LNIIDNILPCCKLLADFLVAIFSALLLFLIRFIIFQDKAKVKAISLQAWTGPEGSRRLRLPDFKTVGT
jgi:hypothetical protein